MAGLNTTGKPSPTFYNLGRGKVLFGNPIVTSTGLPASYRHLGNATEFSATVESETLEHQSSREGLKTTDKEVVISQAMNLSITLDEISFQNLALFFSGTAATEASANPTVDGFTTAAADLVGGEWYDLIDASDGSRGYDLNPAAAITSSYGSITEGVEYELDRTMGRVFIVAGAALDGETATTFTVPAWASASADLDVLKALTQSSITGALKFVSENPANSDKQTEYQFHSVSLKAEGDASMIGDEFTTITLTGTAEKNETADADSPTLTITTHANA